MLVLVRISSILITIVFDQKCDGENDCSDVEASDEANCTNIGHSKLLPYPGSERPNFPVNSSCLDWMFKCENGNCLPDWWRCDAIDDCGDHSDEVGCGIMLPEMKTITPEHTISRQKCGKSQFTCAPGKIFYTFSYRHLHR